MVAVGRLVLAAAQHLQPSLSIGAAIDLSWLGFCFGLWFWAIVGIWRSSNREAGQLKWMARGIVVFGSLLLLPIATASSKSARELAQLAAGKDPMGVPAHVRLDRDRIIVEGKLAEGSADAFERVLKESRAASVTLTSPGGRIAEGKRIAELVRTHHLDTEAEGLCASACTLVLLAGRNRSMDPEARVGFHQTTFAGNGAADDDLQTEEVRTYFQEAGVDGAFVRKAFSTSSAGMWYPTEDEMLSAGFLNRRGIEVLLGRAAQRLNPTLPRRVDRITVWRRADANASTLTYRYSVALPDDVDESMFRAEMAGHLQNQACGNAGLRALIEHQARVAFDYTTDTGRHLATIVVAGCSTTTARAS